MRVVISLFPRFTALDAVGPYEVLRCLPDTEVVFAAETAGEVRNDNSQLGLTADLALADVEHADVLLVPGGPGTRTLLGPEAAAFRAEILRLHATAAWTTSVCTGSLVLGAAGLLDGLEATTHWSAVEALESFGAKYTAQRVVRQGQVVTAAGVSAGIDMALTLAGLIAGDEVAKAIQLGIEYDPQPPFDAGSVAKAGPAVLAIAAGGFRRLDMAGA